MHGMGLHGNVVAASRVDCGSTVVIIIIAPGNAADLRLCGYYECTDLISE